MQAYKLTYLRRFNNTQWFDSVWFQYFANYSDAEKVRDVLNSNIPEAERETHEYVIETIYERKEDVQQ